MALPPVPVYPGRNSPKDVAGRVWGVEADALPALQTEIDDVDRRLSEETDIPDLALILQSALT